MARIWAASPTSPASNAPDAELAGAWQGSGPCDAKEPSLARPFYHDWPISRQTCALCHVACRLRRLGQTGHGRAPPVWRFEAPCHPSCQSSALARASLPRRSESMASLTSLTPSFHRPSRGCYAPRDGRLCVYPTLLHMSPAGTCGLNCRHIHVAIWSMLSTFLVRHLHMWTV